MVFLEMSIIIISSLLVAFIIMYIINRLIERNNDNRENFENITTRIREYSNSYLYYPYNTNNYGGIISPADILNKTIDFENYKKSEEYV